MNTNKRLLIADDDDQIRELLVFDIQSSGYIADSASDGEIALKKALENNYDLILLDVMMPKINGFLQQKTTDLVSMDTTIQALKDMMRDVNI